MTFAHPIWLYLTPLLLLLFGGMIAYGLRRRDALLSRFAAGRLLRQLTEQASVGRAWLKAGCILLAVLAIGVALARPQLGVEWTERKARGLDIVFVIDSSKSMLATDIRPSRLERAKLAIRDLIERLESDRVGLVAFAGQAFLQTPPTLDYAAFRESLDAIDPNIMTSGGSDLGRAIEEAAEAFPSENNVKVVVLLTDGEDLAGSASEAARTAHESGIQIFAIGIGTPEGAYLRIPDESGNESFVRDAEGQPVLSQLDETTLQAVAETTGGSYRRLSSESLDQLYRQVLATLPREERESELQEVRTERFQWALSIAVALLILEFFIRQRRTSAVQASCFIFVALCAQPPEATAQENRPTDPRVLFNDAHEALSAGEFESALEGYEAFIAQTEDRRLEADALYNMGHASHQLGRGQYESGDLQGALEQMKRAEDLFRSARDLNPDDPDITEDLTRAERVREAVEKILEQQKDQPEQESEASSDQSQESSDDSESTESDPSENSSQEDQDTPEEQPEQESGDDASQDAPQEPSGQDEDSGGSESSGEQEGDETSPSDSGESDTDASDPAESDADGEAPQPDESTADPVDDLPEPQAGDEADQQGEEPTADADGTEPEPGAADATTTGQAAMDGESTEGMSEADAAALLDSLRGREKLLPFNDASRTGRSREVRDW